MLEHLVDNHMHVPSSVEMVLRCPVKKYHPMLPYSAYYNAGIKAGPGGANPGERPDGLVLLGMWRLCHDRA